MPIDQITLDRLEAVVQKLVELDQAVLEAKGGFPPIPPLLMRSCEPDAGLDISIVEGLEEIRRNQLQLKIDEVIAAAELLGQLGVE